jgi:hypothetical protein
MERDGERYVQVFVIHTSAQDCESKPHGVPLVYGSYQLHFYTTEIYTNTVY